MHGAYASGQLNTTLMVCVSLLNTSEYYDLSKGNEKRKVVSVEWGPKH